MNQDFSSMVPAHYPFISPGANCWEMQGVYADPLPGDCSAKAGGALC